MQKFLHHASRRTNQCFYKILPNEVGHTQQHKYFRKRIQCMHRIKKVNHSNNNTSNCSCTRRGPCWFAAVCLDTASERVIQPQLILPESETNTLHAVFTSYSCINNLPTSCRCVFNKQKIEIKRKEKLIKNQQHHYQQSGLKHQSTCIALARLVVKEII